MDGVAIQLSVKPFFLFEHISTTIILFRLFGSGSGSFDINSVSLLIGTKFLNLFRIVLFFVRLCCLRGQNFYNPKVQTYPLQSCANESVVNLRRVTGQLLVK